MIRRCSPGDWPEVRRLHVKLALEVPVVVDVELNNVLTTPQAYWQEFVERSATARDQALFVASEDEGVLAGMGQVALESERARSSLLFVEPERRRRGLGSGLVAAGEGWAVEAGARELVGHVPDRSAAAFLAERRGWRSTGGVFFTEHGLRETEWVKAC